MATAMIYDTLKLAEQLEHEAGFDAPRARAMARILAENTGGNLATREDIKELATATREDIQKLAMATREDTQKLAMATREDIQKLATATREDIQKLATATREDIQELAAATRDGIQKLATKGELRAEIQGLRSEVQDIRGDIRVLYWMTGTTVAGIAGILGIAITVALHVMHLG
jgi:small-conductance mechanosensitive channel